LIAPSEGWRLPALQVGNSIVYCFARPGVASGFVVVDEKGVERGSTDAFGRVIDYVVPVHGVPAGLLLIEGTNPETRVVLYRWDLTNKPVPVTIDIELPPDAAKERNVPK